MTVRGLPPEAVTAGQMTYLLRRLRTYGLVTDIPRTRRYSYRVTDHGLRMAMLLTRVHDRLLPTATSTPAPTQSLIAIQVAR